MNILITGGAGFIGAHCAERLMAQGYRVMVLDALTYAGRLENLESVSAHQNFSFHKGNVCDLDSVAKLLETHRPSAIIHAAAETHVDRSIDGPDVFLETNVRGTHTLLRAARSYYETLDAAQRTAFRFVHMSTDEVFGAMGAGEHASENSPYGPRSPYAASKAAADHFVRSYHVTYGLPTIIVHPSNNYGPRQFPEKLIPVVLMNILQGNSIPLYGDGAQEREWLFVGDCAAAVEAALLKGEPGESYCIGPAGTLRNREVVEILCRLMDERRPSPKGPYARLVQSVTDRPGHDRRYCLNTQKAAQKLGWRSEVSFEAGLKQTVDWYLDHEDFLAQPHTRIGLGFARNY